MANVVRCGLIQTRNDVVTTGNGTDKSTIEKIKQNMLDKHLEYTKQAHEEGVQVLCFQEIFNGPYFCAEQHPSWYESAEDVPDGPTVTKMREVAKQYNMVLVVPIYEREQKGVFYNTAAVIDADGTYLGKYRKTHIPQVNPGFWEKFYFRPGNLGYPVFRTKYAVVGVYICYDRHFPEGARALGLAGAEIVFNPSATVAGLSEYLWKLEQPAHAAANGYFVGAINRVGYETPWNMGEFYGQSYLVDPSGEFVVRASRDRDEAIVGEMDRRRIREVRNTWQFYRDRRPETYGDLLSS